MKTVVFRAGMCALLIVTAASLAMAFPVKVTTAGGDSQTVTMCPDCGHPLACAQKGDYTIAVSADVQHAKQGGGTNFAVRLTDRNGAPVTNAVVTLVLSMTGHSHPPRTVRLRRGSGGRYSGSTTLQTVHMQGPWNVDVQVKSPKGDTVTQRFVFNR